MKRRFSSRLLGALLAPWFAFVVAEPVSMHACAMHSGHGGTPSSEMAGSGGHAEHGAKTHAGVHAAAEPAQSETPAPSNQHPCNCMGMGCQAGAVPLPAAQTSLVEIASHRAALNLVPTSADTQPASQREHDRPFAIGPPTLRA